MSKKTVGILVVLLLLLAPLGSVYASETFRMHTGVVINDKDAMDVLTLFAPGGEHTSWLIGNKGNVVHAWNLEDSIPISAAPTGPGDTAYFDGPQVQSVNALGPGLHDRLLPNGNLLRGYRPDTYDYAPGAAVNNVDENFKVGYSPAGGTAGGVLELDWKNNLLWWYPLKDAMHIQHHTFYRVVDTSPYQGHTFILAWEYIDCATALAAGRTTCAGEAIYPDMIREVDANKNTVWEWHVWDHTTAVQTDAHKFFLDAQTTDHQPERDWTHGNTVEFNPVTDQVIINFRNWGEFFIIDHGATYVDGDPAASIALAATDAGDPIFRWGNPVNYGAGEGPEFNYDGDQELFGEHCVVWLGVDYQNGYGPAGNVLIFDNGWNRPAGNRSRSVEMTPNGVGAAGVAVEADWLQPNSPLVWDFAPIDASAFYAHHQGGTGRVYTDPDDSNVFWTFVTSTQMGALFQVKTDLNLLPGRTDTVVWDFIVPLIGADGKRLCYHDDGQRNTVHRAHQYLLDYPAFDGRKIEAQYAFSGNCTQYYDLWDSKVVAGGAEEAAPLTGWGFTGTGIGGGGGGGAAGGGGGGGGY